MNAVEGEEGEDDDADGGQAYKIGEGEPHGDLLGEGESQIDATPAQSHELKNRSIKNYSKTKRSAAPLF